MNVELSNETIEILNKIFLKKYNDFTQEEILMIQQEGKGITFPEIMSYFDHLQEHEDLLKTIEDDAEKNLIGIIACLYSNYQIINDFSQYGYYSEIPALVNFRKEKGLETDYELDFSKLIRECIDKGNIYEATILYSISYANINDDVKKELFNFVVERKSDIYVSENRIEGIVDLLKSGKRLGLDISILWELVTPQVLINLCTNEEYDVINVFYEKSDEKGKKLIDGFYKIKDSEVITEDVFNSIINDIDEHSIKVSIAQFAIKKGYIPPLKGFKSTYFSDDESIITLSNINLVYYILTKNDYTSRYFEEKLEKALITPEAKLAFKTIKDYKPAYSWYWNSAPEIIYELEDLLSIQNIPKYFDETGFKIEFLYELGDRYFKKISSDDNGLMLYIINNCKDKIPKEEYQYYDLIATSLNFYETYYSYGFFDSFKKIIETKETFYSFINDEEKIINVLQNKYNLELIFGLLKTNIITDDIKNKVFTEKEIVALDVIKELLDKEIDEAILYRSLYQNTSIYDDNKLNKNKLITYLLENNHIEPALALSNKYVSDIQRNFLLTSSKILEKVISTDSEKRRFVIETITNKEQLSKFIVDNKPTKELIDKFFELGCLYCIEGHEDLLSDKQKMIYAVYKSIENKELQEVYCDFIESSFESIYSGVIPEETIKKIPALLDRIKLSNSSEVAGRYINIAKLILQNTNENNRDPLIQFQKIEKIFLTRELSHMDKIFKSFQLLYPHDKLLKTIKDNPSHVSPTLYKYATDPEGTILGKEAQRLYGDSTYAVEMIMYADLLKTTLASNDKTFIDYIENIEIGNQIFSGLMSGEKDVRTLTADEKYVLNTYVYHLENLYNKSHIDNTIKMTKDLDRNLSLLMILYKEVNISSIPDQIIKNKYQAYLGISTIKELKDIMSKSKIEATEKGYQYSRKTLVLEKGDLIKGIGNITYFDTIIQNGSVSKEFLGGDVDSDLTPFDTDLSIISETKASNSESRNGLEANSYGPIFFIIKNAMGKYNCTRDDNDKEFELVETNDQFRKIEIFKTLGGTHFGIRTGFATTQVDYICCEDNFLIDKIGLVLAKNGIYIPVVNKEGKLVFAPEEYEHLRGKMAGLSYYRVDSFEVSPTVENELTLSLTGAIRDNIVETQRLKKELEEKLRSGFALSGLLMKTQIDGDMQPGSVELIDTGSTGRGTNQIGDGDFDFTIRLDRIINQDNVVSSEVAKKVCEALGISPKAGDLRKEKVMIDDKEVELDISYASKSDRITYTTDMSLADRLETIKRQDPDKYLLVLSNIVLAKTMLKKGECYKPHHSSDNPQGGLGGVGTENWILQNGGSLEEAATEFLIAAGIMRVEVTEEGKKEIIIDETTQKEYDTFKTSYSIWDFGQNQLSEKRSREFPYDNFVWNNMNPKGYAKMAKVMQTYILELHPEIKLVPKPIPLEETQAEREEREKINQVVTNVRTLLQGLKPTKTYETTDDLTAEKGK